MSKQKHEEKDKLVIQYYFLSNNQNNFYRRCELHQEKLSVYCSSCSKCICHQCALFNGSVSTKLINLILILLLFL